MIRVGAFLALSTLLLIGCGSSGGTEAPDAHAPPEGLGPKPGQTAPFTPKAGMKRLNKKAPQP